MRHPTEGVLRRLLDEPAGVADPDREHIATCDGCVHELAAIRADADLVHAALATDVASTVDLDTAWQRLSAAGATATMPTTPGPARVRAAAPRAGRLRATVRRPVVAGVVAAALVAGAGAAAASGWVQIFRTEQITPIGLSTADLSALPDLSEYGQVEVTRRSGVHPVPDAAAAEVETGLDVPEVSSLPQGVTGEPEYQVGGDVNATFTFSAERAAQAAADAGEELEPLPPGLDGSQVRLQAGPGVAEVWSHDTGVPSLIVGRAIAPTAFTSSPAGVPFETLRDYLLSLPGVPESVAAPLRTYNADSSTLPLPIPADRVKTSTATVDGHEATVLTARDRSLAAVVWVDDGVMTVVGGALDADEVLTVARGLR
jgi:hypothetical protein